MKESHDLLSGTMRHLIKSVPKDFLLADKGREYPERKATDFISQ